MANEEVSQGLTTSQPMSAPPTPVAPAPPSGAMDKGVTGADPENSLMAEATRLGGPLGGIAIGAATGAAHHAESTSSVKLDMSTSRPLPVKLDMSTSRPLPSQRGRGAAALSNTEDIGTGPEGTIGTDQLMSQESQADASKKGGILAGTMVGALAAPAAATLAGGGLAGSIAGGAAAGGTGTVAEQIAQGENPFRAEMMKQTAESAAIGGVTGGVLHGAGKAVGGIANKLFTLAPSETEVAGLPSEVTEQHFTKIPDAPSLGDNKTPFKVDQPFDTATIAGMRQGRTLPEEARNLLQQYVGDTIPAGSHPVNTAMKAVAPVNESIDRLGLEMNKAINMYPSFAQSANEDAEVGTPLIEDLQTMKERLPHGASGKQSEIITNAHAAAHDALVSTDPQEILAARRKLGQQIDWTDLTQNPDTDKEVQQAARARIYQALTDKLKQIPGVKEIDAEFQPNLELYNWLDKVLPEGMASNPTAADLMQTSEFKKGLKINAVKAHNERIAQNRAVAGRALRYGTEALLGGGVVGGVGYEIGKGAAK